MPVPSIARAQFGFYLRNALLGDTGGSIFGDVLRFHYWAAKVRKPPRDDPASGDDDSLIPAPGTDDYAKLHAVVAARLDRFRTAPAGADAFERNVVHAAEAFALLPLDMQILQLVLRSQRINELRQFANAIYQQMEDIPRNVAAMLGVDPGEVEYRLRPAAPLRNCGVLILEPSPHHFMAPSEGLYLPKAMRRHLSHEHVDAATLATEVIGRECRPVLDWADFRHLGEAAEVAARALAAAVKQKESGVHILLVGPPGTGKTEFAAALAARAGLRLYAAGEMEEHGAEPSRAERLAALRSSQAVLQSLGNSAALLDEAEDVLESARSYGTNRDTISKAFLNRGLETAAVPTIWACNALGWMDPATLRRMTMVIEVKVPDLAARQRIWTRVLQREAVVLDPEAPERLARRWTAPAAAAASAARAARLAGGGEPTLETALAGVMAVLGQSKVDDAGTDGGEGEGFDIALTSCADDLEALCRTLARPGAPCGWSLCVSGPPGTGKSGFARYLAQRLGLPVLHKRASDLLSMWVGGSEQAIAAAFAEARTLKAMLLIDEAEALLFDRGAAERSFEVSQVNEMLTWMERHPLPMVCTTNLPDRMDRAVPRRFTLKLRFEALDAARAELAFRRLLAAEPPGALPEGLTPGDFSVVKKKAVIFGVQEPERLLDWLYEEVAAKGGNRAPIGYRPIAPVLRSTTRVA